MAASDLNATRLHYLLQYNPDSGEFTRKTAISNRSKTGDPCSSLTSKGYIRICVDGSMQYAHRLAWLYVHGQFPIGALDHINGNKRDNRIENLRDVPPYVNSQNMRRAMRDNGTGFLGVSRHSRGYVASICTQGERRHLGLFKLPEEAHAAYLNAKRRLHEGSTL